VKLDQSRQNTGRARRRAGAIMALLVGPVILVVIALRTLGPHNYPAGDIRNEPLFWAALGVLALVVIGTLVIGSIRLLIRGNTSDRPDM
jgi:hypothetical protein